MDARITISKTGDGELNIFINEEGRDLLVASLSDLSEKNDHFHLSSDGAFGIELRKIPYNETDEIFEWAKILFRPDKWDAEYFPHVLE